MRQHVRTAASRSRTRHTVALGALLGFTGLFAFPLVVSGVRLQYGSSPVPPVEYAPVSVPFALHAALGGIAVGGTVAYLYERHRTVAPPVLATAFYLAAVSWTAWRIHGWERPGGIREPLPPLLPWVTAYEYVVLGWPLLLAGALLAAMLEGRLEGDARP